MDRFGSFFSFLSYSFHFFGISFSFLSHIFGACFVNNNLSCRFHCWYNFLNVCYMRQGIIVTLYNILYEIWLETWRFFYFDSVDILSSKKKRHWLIAMCDIFTSCYTRKRLRPLSFTFYSSSLHLFLSVSISHFSTLLSC